MKNKATNKKSVKKDNLAYTLENKLNDAEKSAIEMGLCETAFLLSLAKMSLIRFSM